MDAAKQALLSAKALEAQLQQVGYVISVLFMYPLAAPKRKQSRWRKEQLVYWNCKDVSAADKEANKKTLWVENV